VSTELAEEDPEGPAADASICTPSDVAAQYARHHEDLHRVASRFFAGRRPGLAEDAVMNVFARLLELARQRKLTDKGDGWGAYLRRAVHNSCVDIVRQEEKERTRFPAGDPDRQRIVAFDPLGDSIAATDHKERTIARLAQALSDLDEIQLAIVKHKLWDGWTDKAIGDTLGITGQAVGQRLKTILKTLHKEVTNDE
jgi:RNA polymerase sigma factor (sigma-70 family)